MPRRRRERGGSRIRPLRRPTTAAHAGAGIQPGLLGTKKLSDGETYPTYGGWLLCEYTGDAAPGQAHGQKIKSFGGTWYTVSPTGKPVEQGS